MAPPILAIDSSDPAADGSRWAFLRTALPVKWLQPYWLSFMIAADVSVCASLAVILIIVLRPNLRSQSFNQFIVGLVLADFLFSFCCAWTCFSHYLAGHWQGGALACTTQGIYVVYGFAASMWMHVVVAHELRRLASSLASMSIYRETSTGTVCWRVACVHLGALALALVPEVPGVPAAYGAHRGLACAPMEYDPASTVFLWCFTLNIMLVGPCLALLLYFRRVYILIFRSSKEVCAADRLIFDFFLRLLLVFLGMWLPTAALIWIVVWEGPISQHLFFVGGMWSHLQGLVSACFYLRKSDIRAEVARLTSECRAAIAMRSTVVVLRPVTSPTESGSSPGQGDAVAKMLIHQLSVDVMAAICAKEQAPMRVVELATWLKAGRFPRSSDGVTRPLMEGDVVIFVSHRWWGLECPDDDEGSKYAKVSQGARCLVARHKLDQAKVVLWCDWACIDQDDADLQAQGVASLITYAARSSFVLIPVSCDPACVQAFREARHPMMLRNYGERAWCRLEVYIFMCVSEICQRPPRCYGYGPAGDASVCWPARDRLRPLTRSFTKGAAFDLAKLPSTGDLTRESDRSVIRDVEEAMRDIYVRTAILAEKLRLEAMSSLRVCSLQEKQVRCMDVPQLARDVFSRALAPRMAELRLDGNLLAADGVATLLKDIVCAEATSSLATLSLSNNPHLGTAAIMNVAAYLAHPFFTLSTLRLSRCGLTGEAAEPLAETLPACASLRLLDLSQNQLGDGCCEKLLEACGGSDRPAVLLELQGNPISAAIVLKVARARIAVELGHRSRRSVAYLLHEHAQPPGMPEDGKRWAWSRKRGARTGKDATVPDAVLLTAGPADRAGTVTDQGRTSTPAAATHPDTDPV